MAQTRNLIIGCDGTWNDTDSTITNVAKLLEACAAKNQVTHYEEGVGTAYWEALPGGIYGKGLDRQILGAYRFLRRLFADKQWQREDNKVFIFGFSRGAYAARRLAGLISRCGVPVKAADVDLAWQIYLRRDSISSEKLKEDGRLFDIPVEMLGVWDTVKTTTDEDFNDLTLSPNVVKGYHAMAIDEKRTFFPVLKWNAEDRVNQIWFSGVHSDVGGGYADCRQSDLALRWMIDRGYEHGLQFKASAVNALNKDYTSGTLHNSFDGIWKAFGTSARQIGNSEKVHVSTRERLHKVADYKPTNLPQNPNFVA